VTTEHEKAERLRKMLDIVRETRDLALYCYKDADDLRTAKEDLYTVVISLQEALDTYEGKQTHC
jgi:hypothetical protein